MKKVTVLLYILFSISGQVYSNDPFNGILLPAVLALTKPDAPNQSKELFLIKKRVTSYSDTYSSKVLTALVSVVGLGVSILAFKHIQSKLKHDAYDEGSSFVLNAPEPLRAICYSLLLECGFSKKEAARIEICVKLLPKDIYGYADYDHNRIVLNTQWCMISTFYTSRFDTFWSSVLSWWITPGLAFVFCHEAMHLKEHAQVTCKGDKERRRRTTLFCEMKADLGALNTLLNHGHWGAVFVSLSTVLLDRLRSVSYGSWAPTASERWRCWKKFCKDFIFKKKPSCYEYADNYIEELEDLA